MTDTPREPYLLPIAQQTIAPGTEPYWDALRERRLVLPRCVTCAQTFWYPRPFCPRCLADDISWEEASGGGVLYSLTVVQRAFGDWNVFVPYAVGLVSLPEGPTIQTLIPTRSPVSLKVGTKVHAVFPRARDGEQRHLQFAPVEEEDDASRAFD